MTYAIVRTGGKQHRLEEGRLVRVERLAAAEGDVIELTDVLVLNDGTTTTVGTPVVEGARVIAEVMGQGRSKKVTVFKYKPKVRYRRKTGHRQAYTELRIDEILAPGQEPTPRKRREDADQEEAPAEAVDVGQEVAPEAELGAGASGPEAAPQSAAGQPEDAGQPKPRRRSRKKAEE